MGRIKYSLPMINSYVIEIPENKVNSLRGINGILSVHHTAQIAAQSSRYKPYGGSGLLAEVSHADQTPLPSGLTPPIKENSARDAARASKLQYRGFTGKGISVAILDTGVSPVADLTSPSNRIRAFKDFVNGKEQAYDDNGHGTQLWY